MRKDKERRCVQLLLFSQVLFKRSPCYICDRLKNIHSRGKEMDSINVISLVVYSIYFYSKRGFTISHYLGYFPHRRFEVIFKDSNELL